MNLDKLCGFDSFCHSIPAFPTDSVTAGGGGGGKVLKVDSDGSGKAREIDLGKDFGDVVVKANGAQVRIDADGSLHGVPAPANDTAAKATHEIGAVELAGDHKGEIYGGIFPDGNPGWISEEPKPMSHYDAVELKGRALPTSKEGKYIDTIKGIGDLKDIFARHSDGTSSAGFFWLAQYNHYGARFQQFSDGSQNDDIYGRNDHLPVLSVRR
jgi:hypothetical protein